MKTIDNIKNYSTVYVEMPVENLTREMVQNILHTEYFHVNCLGTDEQLEIINATDWNTAMENWRAYGVKAVAINDAHWYDAVYPISEAYEKKCDEWKAAKAQAMEAMNNYDKSNGNRVRFISYTGDYPNLCHGVLTLEIDGKEYKFGHNYSNYHYDGSGKGIFTDEDPANPNFESFWMSGGCIAGGMEDLHAETGEWHIDADDLPEQFRDIADEIGEVFNNNVPWGCCGGCI